MRALKFKLAVLAIPVALILVMVAIGGQRTTDQEKATRIANVESGAESEVNSICPVGTPILIKAASTREISKLTFRNLTGEAARHPSMSTYPDVTLVNTSQKTITSMMIMVRSKAEPPGSGHGLVTKDMSLAPGAKYWFESSKWPRAEKVFVEKDGRFVSVLSQPGLDSPKSWLPGAASDLTVVIVKVVFEDGTQWTVPAGFDF